MLSLSQLNVTLDLIEQSTRRRLFLERNIEKGKEEKKNKNSEYEKKNRLEKTITTSLI